MPILSNFPGGAGSGSGGLTLAAVSGCDRYSDLGRCRQGLCEVD